MPKHKKPVPPTPKPTGAAAAAPPSGLLGKLMATVEQASPAAGFTPPTTWSEPDVVALLDQLPAEALPKFQGFVDQFASMGSQLKDAVARSHASSTAAAASKTDYEERLASLSAEKERVSKEHDDLDSQQREMATKDETLAQRQSALAVKERQLETREADLRAGLFEEQQRALESLRSQVAELERQRAQLPVAMDADRQRILQGARGLADQLTALAREHAEEGVQREAELAKRALELEQREGRIRVNEELIKARRASLTQEIEETFKTDLQRKDDRIERLENQRTKQNEKIDQLQGDLDEFQNLRDQLRGSPQQLLDELERYKRQSSDLDRRIQDLLASRSEDDTALLRSQRDSLQDRLTTAENELFDLRRREGGWRRSVTEREDWQRERVALQKSRDLLADAVNRLQSEVDGLINRQKDGTPFPELTRMDVQFATPVATQPPPTLQNLVTELQSRVAFAESGKRLHFRTEDLQLFVGGLAMSQLHILQGISGTGKTSLATAFAKAVGGVCTTVPVQAGWRDRADLLGHYNAFEKRFYERNTLQAIYRAQTDGEKERLHIVLLDEMNLSRPEQYFAEFLSALELPEPDRWINLMEARPAQGAPAKFRDGRDIKLPANVWFLGTANHDETTSAFADKTHDRAFVLDLPKHEPAGLGLKPPTDQATWQYSALKRQFDHEEIKGKANVQELLKKIDASALTKVLQDDFDLGWGNRLERQMARFLPVVLAVGGTDGLAVDHLLSTRMFRDGKVVGRHDVRTDDLKKVEQALTRMWKDCQLQGEPTKCLRQLRRDIQRLERGG